MKLPIYAHPSDEVLSSATVTVTAGTEDASYPATNVIGGDATNPAKFTTTNATIKFTFGAPKSIALVGLIHPNLTAGLNVRWQGSADNFSTTSLDQPLVIQATDLDGFVPGSYADLTALSHSYQYWRIVVPTDVVNIILGQLVGYTTTRTVTYFLQPGGLRARTRFVVRNTTEYGVDLTFDRGARQREKTGQIGTANLAAVQQWFDAARGMARPFLFIPDPDVDNEAWLARWNVPSLQVTRTAPQYWTVTANFIEVSRGLPWLVGA